MYNCVLAECWGSHEMVDRFSINWETSFTIIHHDSNTSCCANFATKVCLPWFAKLALSAFCLVARDNMITWLNLSHTFTNTFYNPVSRKPTTSPVPIKDNTSSWIHWIMSMICIPSSLMAKNTREEPFRILQGKN